MKIRNWIIVITLSAGACTSFENAEPTSRNSFMYFYSSGLSFEGAVAESDPDGGYIIGANIPLTGGNSDGLIIKTDAKGSKIWEQVLKNTIINAIKPISEGYLVLGDSIKLDPASTEISEIVNTRARLMFMDPTGNIVRQLIRKETVETSDGKLLEVDFHGNGIAVNNSGQILILGSRKTPGANERSFIACVNPNDFSVAWTQSYGLMDRDYINCNTLFVTPSSKLVWASRTVRSIQNLSDEYLSISYVEPNSTFENNSLFGENEAKNHSPEDIQKSAVGYAVTGTYADQDGSNSNLYFLRVDQSGNIIEGSERYFDGINLAVADRNESATNDTGNAIASVDGGYVIAGSMVSTPTVGSGGRDIILLKVDITGNLEWSKLIGGSGDETVSSIRRTPDNGLLICGTNTISGLASIMLIKTDENGEVTQ